MNMKSNKGFTLIELVMVIVILGILAAVAAPKFQNLSTQAKAASFLGVVGGVKSGITIWQANYLASGSPTAGVNSVLGNSDGYPAKLGNAGDIFGEVLGSAANAAEWTYSAGSADGDFAFATGGTDSTRIYTQSGGTFQK